MKISHIFAAAALAMSALNAGAQEVYRVFDYISEQPEESVGAAMPKLVNELRELKIKKTEASRQAQRILDAVAADDKATLKVLKVTPSKINEEELKRTVSDTVLLENEKIALVERILGTKREQLAAAAKLYIDNGQLAPAAAVYSYLQEKHGQYAYTNMVFAYLSLKRAERYAAASDVLSRNSRNYELNSAASTIEDIAVLINDSVEIKRNLLYLAGELRYEGNQAEECRQDLYAVLKTKPSHEDSLDIGVMLAYFDRSDAVLALKDSDNVRAIDCLERAIESYGAYLDPTRTLKKDLYTAEVIDGYLFCLNQRAEIKRSIRSNDIAAYDVVLNEANRFLNYRTDDIRIHRYKLNTYFQRCMADSTYFQKCRDTYIQSMEYITKQQFPDSLYQYRDYNMAQHGGRFDKDEALRARYLAKCYYTFDDINMDRSEKDNILKQLVVSSQESGDLLGAIAWRKTHIEEVLKDKPDEDMSGSELNMSKAYLSLVEAQNENRTMSKEEQDNYAKQADSIINKYINSSNEDYMVNSTTQKINLHIARMIYTEDSLREQYFNSFRDTMLHKIAWSRVHDKKRVPQQVSGLFRVGYEYIKNATASDIHLASTALYDIFTKLYEDQEDDYDRLDLVRSQLGVIGDQIVGRASVLKLDFSKAKEVADIIDNSLIALHRNSRDIDPTLQNAMLRAQTFLHQQCVAGNVSEEEEGAFVRAHQFTNFVNLQEKGINVYIGKTSINTAAMLNSYRDKIICRYKDLTPEEQKFGYGLLASGYYDLGFNEYQEYFAAYKDYRTKVAKGQRASSKASDDAQAKALATMEEAYFFSYKAMKAGDPNAKTYISRLEDMKFAAPAVEKATTRIELDKAESL